MPDDTHEWVPCLTCGRSAQAERDAVTGREWVTCWHCIDVHARATDGLRRQILNLLPQPPTTLTGRVASAVAWKYPTLDAAMAATDDELLAERNFGRGMLACWRGLVPAPVPLPTADPAPPDWAEHAAMLTLETV